MVWMSAAHLVPTIGHPLLVFFKSLGLHQSFKRRLDRIGRNPCEDLRCRGRATVELPVLSRGRGDLQAIVIATRSKLVDAWRQYRDKFLLALNFIFSY